MPWAWVALGADHVGSDASSKVRVLAYNHVVGLDFGSEASAAPDEAASSLSDDRAARSEEVSVPVGDDAPAAAMQLAAVTETALPGRNGAVVLRLKTGPQLYEGVTRVEVCQV